MWHTLLIILLEIFGLWLVSRNLIRQIFTAIMTIFRSRPLAVSIVTALLFPGTVIHELSHLFTAEILGVRTGKLRLSPESIEGEDIRVGSVELSQTDPFRRSVIGLAPFFVGLTALFTLCPLLPNLWSDAVTACGNNALFSSPSLYLLPLVSYLLFCISATMFASSEDMKGVIPLGIVLGILGAALYMSGVRIGITGAMEKNVSTVLSALSTSLGVVLFLNLLLYFFASAVVWIKKQRQGKK